MSMKIITGKTGTPHVEAADDASLYEGIVGVDIVLPVGNKFSYELINNNLIKINDGDILIQGHLGRIVPGDYENVTINNGTQGQKRNDLIVARYSKDATTGFESMVLATVEGTPGTTVVDPALTVGNLRGGALIREVPLYRVSLDGLNVASVTSMMNISKSIIEGQNFKLTADNGRTLSAITDFNTAKALGEYTFTTSTLSNPIPGEGFFGVLRVEKRTEADLMQTARGFLGNSTEASATRWSSDGGTTWGEWNVSFAKRGNNGYFKTGSGIIFQWGTITISVTANSVATQAVTFPISFTSTPLTIQLTPFSGSPQTFDFGTDTWGASSFNIKAFATAAGSVTVRWFALGY